MNWSDIQDPAVQQQIHMTHLNIEAIYRYLNGVNGIMTDATAEAMAFTFMFAEV